MGKYLKACSTIDSLVNCQKTSKCHKKKLDQNVFEIYLTNNEKDIAFIAKLFYCIIKRLSHRSFLFVKVERRIKIDFVKLHSL